MIKNVEILDKCCKVMKERFIEEEDIQLQFKGIDNAEELMMLQAKGTIETFNNIDCLEVIDDGLGFLIGYNTEEWTDEKLIPILVEASQKNISQVNEKDMAIMQENSKVLGELAVLDWYKKYYDGPVFILSIIAIDKSLKGTGAFRRLISSVIQKYENVMPIVLQTYSKENVEIYEHFGFRIMEQNYSDKVNLTCHNMMKWDK